MTTGAGGQEALLALQDLDSDLDRHRHRRAALPERTELAETQAAATAAGAARDEAVARRDAVVGRQQTLEAELASTEAHIAELNRRLTTGGIGTAREVTALTTNIEHLRERVSDLEDQILEAMEERGPLEEMADAAATDVARLDARRESLAERVAQAEEEIDGELVDLDAQRHGAAAAVPTDLQGTYERLRRRLGGVAVARLVGDRCDGCHLTLPATEVDHIKHAPADELIFCDQCERILVRPRN